MLEYLEKLWIKLEIKVLLISSLSLQIFNLALANYRKDVILSQWARTTDNTWQGPLALIFHILLWLTYLMADYVAIVGLGYLHLSEISKATPQNKTPNLIMFWTPFFLLHLGGQDNITALSSEDNELWMRHLLTMLSQVVLALYKYFSFNFQAGALTVPTVLIFAVAIFKYGERIWSLQRSSRSALQSSMTRPSDPGLDYAKQMPEYTKSIAAGLQARIDVKVEKHKSDLKRQQTREEAHRQFLQYSDIVFKAYEFFPTSKRHFLDKIMTSKKWEDSQKYLENLQTFDAYKLIEIELSWMFDILHTKSSVFYAFKHYGWVSRLTTIIITAAAVLLFLASDHTEYGDVETILTFVLLGSALCVDIICLFFILVSFWTYVAIEKSGSWPRFSNFILLIQKKLKPKGRLIWPNHMSQYSLITYSLQDKPYWWTSIMKFCGFKQTWDYYRYSTCVSVNKDLLDLVFQQLKKKGKNKEDRDGHRITVHRGQWALESMDKYSEFGWSIEVEFDESILLWHIATDLLFHHLKRINRPFYEKFGNHDISQHISSYMLFLLTQRTFMMPAGLGQVLFDDTCAEGRRFLHPEGDIMKKGDAVRKILDMDTEVDPRLFNTDNNMSVFFTGCKLAHQLEREFTNKENGEQEMWRLISNVWVEMLCYAASKCSGQFHAKQLSKSGEILTVVWLLMAHMGMGEEYRFVKHDPVMP